MRPLPWWRRLGGMLRGRSREREMAAEFESHLQLHIDDHIRAGMPPGEARRAALVKFGPVEAIKDHYRDRAGIPLLEIFLQDLRYAARRIAKQPAFSALVVLTLAIGVGANAAMFGFVDALLFRTPPHVRAPHDLVVAKRAANSVRLREISEGVPGVEVTAYTYPEVQTLGRGPSAQRLRTQCVTGTFFPVLGVAPHRGRLFSATPERAHDRSVVLSHAYWSRQFKSDPAIIGSTVLIDKEKFAVIGVAPRGFRGMGEGQADAWLLLTAAPGICARGVKLFDDDHSGWLTIVARLRDGVDLPAASAQLAVAEGHRKPFVTSSGEVIATRATFERLYPSWTQSLTQDGRLALWLAGGAGVLLLLGCANIAGLLSMRAVDRRREIAIRLQLGAGRMRVVTQLLTEHLLLAALGGLAAVVVAFGLSDGLAAYLSLQDVDVLDGRVFAVLGALALAAGLFSGIYPALRATRRIVVTHLRTGQAVVGRPAAVGTALLVIEVALALLLVAGAGLFVRSVDEFRNDFAYDLDRIVVADIDLNRAGHHGSSGGADSYALFDRVRQLAQVETAALTTGSIGFDGRVSTTFMARGRGRADDTYPLAAVTPEYFATMGLRFTSGRPFTDSESTSPNPPLVVNVALAKALFGSADPVGDCVSVGGQCRKVVGVVESFRSTAKGWHSATEEAFGPLNAATAADPPQFLVVRTRAPAAADVDVDAIAAALQGASPDLPFIPVRPILELVDEQSSAWLLGATAFGLFGTLAVVLATIGIYGALAFSVRQRTVEIGVRLALGAQRTDIRAMVLRRGATVVVVGGILGGACALAMSRLASSLLFNVAPSDPVAFGVAALAIALGALTGCIIPAARAARVDPIVALRYE